MVTSKQCDFPDLKLGQMAGVFSIGATEGIFKHTAHILCQMLKDSGKVVMVGVFEFHPFHHCPLLSQPTWALIN